MPPDTPPPKKKDSDSRGLNRRLLECERSVGELGVTQRAQRKDVIDPLIKKVERHAEEISTLKSVPPPPDHMCVKAPEWKATDERMGSMERDIARLDAENSTLQRQMRETLQTMTKDVNEGIKTRGMVEEVSDDVDEMRSSKRSSTLAIIGILAGFVVTAASGIYFLGGMSANVEAAERSRREDTVRLTKQIKAVQDDVTKTAAPRVIERVEIESVSLTDCFSKLSDRQKRTLLRGEVLRNPPPGCE